MSQLKKGVALDQTVVFYCCHVLTYRSHCYTKLTEQNYKIISHRHMTPVRFSVMGFSAHSLEFWIAPKVVYALVFKNALHQIL